MSTVSSSAAIEAFKQEGDFLALTRALPTHLPFTSFHTTQGLSVEVWDTGVLCIVPANPNNNAVVLSCGIHGNETAPIELVTSLTQQILQGQLPLRCRLLVLMGNPPAMNAGKRELEDNLNRLFSGHHQAAEAGASWERQRAAALEHYVLKFYQQAPSAERFLYDLHTAIRGSVHEKFAVYPFLHGKPWSETQLQFLADCEVNTFLLMQTPASTFSYFAAQTAQAHGFTIELGKVRPFGQNDMSRFAACARMLAQLLSDTYTKPEAFTHERMNFFVVSRSINKQSNEFALCFASDVENFTSFPVGTLLATDAHGVEHRVEKQGEAIIFPNANVAIGQRAILLVKPFDIRGKTQR